jgi:uncharacterized membrane protein YqaE (UPF0057 family)
MTQDRRYPNRVRAKGIGRPKSRLLLVIIAILLPPWAVGLKRGIGSQLILDIILTMLVYLPGLVHALWVVMKD